MIAGVPLAELRAVLLDAGNTLLGMDLDLVATALGRHGIEADVALLERAEAGARPALSRRIAAGGSTESVDNFAFHLRNTLAALGLSERPDLDVLARTAAAEIKRDLATERLWSRVLPGVPEALASLRSSGLALVVVSNSDGTVERALDLYGLGELLDGVVDSRVLGFEKPDPRIFRAGLEIAGAAPAQAAHLGDLYAVDVVGARAAGVHPVLLDPYGDWLDVDCATAPDLATFARHVVASRD